ncbi:MAG: hypothetical protein U0175_26370 [Caldilineaceae bacterium]
MQKKAYWILIVALLLSAQLLVVNVSTVHADVPAGCTELIRNGSFEQLSPDWTAKPGAAPNPVFDPNFKIDGNQSIRLGIVDNTNVAGESSISQQIILPADAVRLILSYRYYTVYSGTPDGGDIQFVDLENTATSGKVRLISETSNATQWRLDQRDLTPNRGQTLRLIFGVINNGTGGRAGMYVDNVSLAYCTTQPATATFTPSVTPIFPTATWTPSPTTTPIVPTATVPTPISCNGAELLFNGGFESDDSWYFGEDPIPARYTGAQKHTGNRSVRLGNSPDLGLADINSYSSIRQLVTIPANATSAQLRWWHLYGTEDPDFPHSPCQQVLLLSPDLKVLRTISNVHRNDGAWLEDAVDLSDLRGQSFYIYFNALNDGNGQRTWMYVDDVSVRACFPAAASAAPAAMNMQNGPLPTAIPIDTPIGSMINPEPVQVPTAAIQIVPSGSAGIEVPTATEEPVSLAPLGAAAAAQPAVTEMVAVPTGDTGTLQGSVAIFVTPTPQPGLLARIFGGGGQSTEVTPSQTGGLNRLGTVAVLLGILVIIALLAMAIVRMLRGR